MAKTQNGSTSYPQVKHKALVNWVKEMTDLCQPDSVVWCDGSDEEYQRMCEMLVKKGTFIRLNPKKRPNSFACFSDPSDVARVEDRTFICSLRKEDAGPTNNWMHPKEMKNILQNRFTGSMQGRTMYEFPIVWARSAPLSLKSESKLLTQSMWL